MDAVKEARIRAGIVAFLNFGHDPTEFREGEPAWNIIERIVDAVDKATTDLLVASGDLAPQRWINYAEGDIIKMSGCGLFGEYRVKKIDEDGTIHIQREIT